VPHGLVDDEDRDGDLALPGLGVARREAGEPGIVPLRLRVGERAGLEELLDQLVVGGGDRLDERLAGALGVGRASPCPSSGA